MATSKGKISDDVDLVVHPGSPLRPADDGTTSPLIGNEQFANTFDDEDASSRDQIKGPDSAQWPVDDRDGGLDVNKASDPDIEDGAEGMVKGPDPAMFPDRPWADEVGQFDPDPPKSEVVDEE